jgi:CheY-like chemotaxis protein/HPt (histidine-containing phosphotransfer) domain-containing protein
MPYGSVLVVDDMEANLYVARGLLKPYELKIETAESGFEAVDKVIAGHVYDIVFMDHMMPKMDGIETVKLMREMGYTNPIVALTANAVAGQADVFLSNGFDDFISKPIDTRQLNDALNKLIRDKQTPEVIAAAREQQKANKKDTAEVVIETSDLLDDPLLKELSQIGDLNVQAGLGFIGNDKDNYLNVLRFFTEKSDTYLRELDESFKSVTWGDYAIKVHALKGVLANIGAERLSKWAAKLERASKPGGEFSPDTCREETHPFMADLTEFRDKLRSTSLIVTPTAEEESSKPAGETQFLKEQMALLKDACGKYSFKVIKEIIAGLGEYKWEEDTQKELENIRDLTVSLDYDKALDGINRLL